MNSGTLKLQSTPRRFLGRVFLLPRPGGGWRTSLRLVLEIEFLRYASALLPFVAAMLIWRDAALPIAQAPIVLIISVGVVELKFLRFSPEARKRLLTEDEVARRQDIFRFRAQKVLSRIAARKELSAGDVLLVVEQSELARIPPLTLVSVQTELPEPRVVPLDQGDQDVIRRLLFDEAFDERALQATNQTEGAFVRVVSYDTRGVSAHARLSARLERQTGTTAAAAQA